MAPLGDSWPIPIDQLTGEFPAANDIENRPTLQLFALIGRSSVGRMVNAGIGPRLAPFSLYPEYLCAAGILFSFSLSESLLNRFGLK